MKPVKRSNFFRLLAYIRPYWRGYVFTVFMGLLKALAPIAIIRLFGISVEVLTAFQAEEISRSEAWDSLLGIFFMGAGILVFAPIPIYLRTIIGARINNSVIRDIRCELYAHIHKLSHSFYDRNMSGALTSRIISDVETVKPFLGKTIIQLWMNLGLIFTILFYFFSKNIYIGLLSISLIPIQILIIRTMGIKIKTLARKIRSKLAHMSGSTQEVLASATVVKTFTQEDDEIRRFQDDSDTLLNMGIRSARLSGVTSISTSVLNMLAPLLVVLIGGRLALFSPETLSLALIVEFVMMQNRLYAPFEALSETQIITANALGAVDRIFSILDTEPEIRNLKGSVKAENIRGDIEFRNVSFSYPIYRQDKILEGFSLEIPEKTTVALVGPSGSGKSTVIKLLNRFYDPDSGHIFIDGTDIKKFRINSLRSKIGLVPQDPVLFSGTVLDNILYGKPGAESDEVLAAAEKANALDFINELPEGIYTRLAESGSSLSGGQKQRIAISRAFLKDPPVLILDEATSALDSASEASIQSALQNLMLGRTTIVIAHRLSTVVNSDKIAVMESGRIIEEGTHPELLGKGGLYSKLCRSQFSAAAGDGGAGGGGD